MNDIPMLSLGSFGLGIMPFIAEDKNSGSSGFTVKSVLKATK
jgi:hypothetical protein